MTSVITVHSAAKSAVSTSLCKFRSVIECSTFLLSHVLPKLVLAFLPELYFNHIWYEEKNQFKNFLPDQMEALC